MNEEATPQIRRAAAARYRADLARHDLVVTAKEMKARLMPAALAKSVGKAAYEKAADGAEQVRKAAQSNPGATGAIAAMAGLFLVWRVHDTTAERDPDRDGE